MLSMHTRKINMFSPAWLLLTKPEGFSVNVEVNSEIANYLIYIFVIKMTETDKIN